MSKPLPYLLEDWEAALTRHFLMISDEVGAIRSFDVCAETLAIAIDALETPHDRIVDAFRSAMTRNKPALYEALEQGCVSETPNSDSPGYFCYLVLTIYVDSQIEHDSHGETEFRPKLAAFLGVDRSFSNLAGVNVMWERLRDWLDDRIQKSDPFRPLILPPKDGWKQIGYSLRLSFPSRRDRTFLGHFLDSNPGVAEDEQKMLRLLRNLVNKTQASPGLEHAFDEFFIAYSGGQRALGDHRFWKLLQDVAKSRSVTLTKTLALEIYPDEDGTPRFALEEFDSGSQRGVLDTLQEAAAEICKGGPSNLRRSTEIGFILFERIGNSRWSAVPSIEMCRGTIKVGLSQALSAAIGDRMGPFQASGDWTLTINPVAVAKAEDALRRFLPQVGEQRAVTQAVLVDGVRTGHHWLGRRSTLPSVVTDLGVPQLKPIEVTNDAAPICEEIKGRINVYSISAKGSLAGSYAVLCDDSILRKVRFVADSFLHEVVPLNGVIAATEWTDWTDFEGRCAKPTAEWQELPQEMDDLLEAIYAGGKSGWDEQDLWRLLSRCLPNEVGCWDFLRSLQEATVLAPFLHARFRGRRWGLRRIELVELQSDAGAVLIINGSLCAKLLDDFKRGVTSLGGVPFRTVSSPWTSPLIGASEISIAALAARLDWPIGQPRAAGGRPVAFADAPLRRLDAYAPAFEWSWKSGRFGKNEDTSHVRLNKLVHRGDRDHDVYLVIDQNRQTTFLVRSSAIVYAHVLARNPLFRFEDDGRLVRLQSDGFLPDAIAAHLRYSTLQNSSPCAAYTYAAHEQQVRSITLLLPGAIDLGERYRPSQDARWSARRGQSVERVVWKDGSIVSSRMPFDSLSRGSGSR